jgi:hypothetical protein
MHLHIFDSNAYNEKYWQFNERINTVIVQSLSQRRSQKNWGWKTYFFSLYHYQIIKNWSSVGRKVVLFVARKTSLGFYWYFKRQASSRLCRDRFHTHKLSLTGLQLSKVFMNEKKTSFFWLAILILFCWKCMKKWIFGKTIFTKKCSQSTVIILQLKAAYQQSFCQHFRRFRNVYQQQRSKIQNY